MTCINPTELEPAEKRKFWQEQIEQQSQSKLTQARFCEQNGLKLDQFTYYKRRFNRKAVAERVTFVSVPIAGNAAASKSPAAFTLITRKGYRIEVLPGFDPATLKQLIAVLELP